jgi:hypothetical protein
VPTRISVIARGFYTETVGALQLPHACFDARLHLVPRGYAQSLTQPSPPFLARKIHDFRNTKGLAMVQIRCLGRFETKNEAFA